MMPATGEAPGKIILVGEHAVVYGRPAIAVPIWETKATATITARAAGDGCLIRARDTEQELALAQADEREPLALVTRMTLRELGLEANPDWRIDVRSDIPIASGMGSGAAVSAAVVRAIYRAAGATPSPQTVSALVYASEEIHHGTPSGIDNTVVSYGRPVWFVRGQEPESFAAAHPFLLAIADSGIASSTRAMVDGVRRRRAACTACATTRGSTRSAESLRRRGAPLRTGIPRPSARSSIGTRRYWRRSASAHRSWRASCVLHATRVLPEPS